MLPIRRSRYTKSVGYLYIISKSWSARKHWCEIIARLAKTFCGRTIGNEDRCRISEDTRSPRRIMKLFFETFARRTASYRRRDKRRTWALGKVRGCTLRRTTRSGSATLAFTGEAYHHRKAPPLDCSRVDFSSHSRHFIPEFSFSNPPHRVFSAVSFRQRWSRVLRWTDLWPPSLGCTLLKWIPIHWDATKLVWTRTDRAERNLNVVHGNWRGELKGGEAKIAEILPTNVALSLAPHDPFPFVSFDFLHLCDTVDI